MFKKALSLITGTDDMSALRMPKSRAVKKLTERELIQMESEIGGKLFGEVPKGHRREFFCLDDKTWVWYEEWIDQSGKRHNMTVRYEVQEKNILKVQEGARYSFLEGDELKNFMAAINAYHERVAREVYRRDPHTGQKFA